MVGKICLLDDKKPMQIIDFNKDETLVLRSVVSHDVMKQRVPVSHVKLIERYGVSVYNLADLPEQMKDAHFSWTCEITTSNKRLLNLIQTKI